MLRTLFSATILAGALAGTAMAQAPDAGCALPSEPEGIPAALDAAITGPADRDRACMKTLLIPEARMMFVSLGADGAPTYTLQTLDEWIARVKARGHAMLEEKQLKFYSRNLGSECVRTGLPARKVTRQGISKHLCEPYVLISR